MIILNYLNYKKEKVLLKKAPTGIAIKFYLTMKEIANIKLILTKKLFNHGSNKIYSNLCEQ